MGWEYFNSRPGGEERPWEWATFMTGILRSKVLPVSKMSEKVARIEEKGFIAVDDDTREEASVPKSFEYFTDDSADE